MLNALKTGSIMLITSLVVLVLYFVMSLIIGHPAMIFAYLFFLVAGVGIALLALSPIFGLYNWARKK